RQQQVVVLMPKRHVARELAAGLVGPGIVGQGDREALLGRCPEARVELAVQLRRDLAQAGGGAAHPPPLHPLPPRARHTGPTSSTMAPSSSKRLAAAITSVRTSGSASTWPSSRDSPSFRPRTPSSRPTV